MPRVKRGKSHLKKRKAILSQTKGYMWGRKSKVAQAKVAILKAGVHGVPGGENMLRKPDGSVRYFTIRECARLQTFPDEYLFHGSWTETMRQLGNAVPVTLAKTVARGVRRQLETAIEAGAAIQPTRQAAPSRKHRQCAAPAGSGAVAAA